MYPRRLHTDDNDNVRLLFMLILSKYGVSLFNSDRFFYVIFILFMFLLYARQDAN